jgi:dual specificity phosphatase 12
MMSVLKIDPTTALAQLQETRDIVEPNPGFEEQLNLYYQMGTPSVNDTPLDDIPAYQRWMYNREVALSAACGQAPETLRFADDQSSGSNDKETSTSEMRCRKCRKVLLTSSFLVEHDPLPDRGRKDNTEEYLLSQHSPNPDQFVPISSLEASATKLEDRYATSSQSARCGHFFTHPLLWMKSTLEQGQLEGRLNCPNSNCGQNVGKYAWQGTTCSCGRWVTPAFSILKSRVDLVKLGTLTKRGPIGTDIRSPASKSNSKDLNGEKGNL